MAVQKSTPDLTSDVSTLHGVQFCKPYTYEPLKEPQAQIRLLHLRPERIINSSSVSNPESVHSEPTFNCSIETIDLNHDVAAEIAPYHAISYVWGDAIDTRPIICDGQVKEVTRNLWDFLLQCWSRTHGELKSDNLSRITSFGRLLWIDAICINQDDLVEKGFQVQQMGRIYSRAAQVIMWLGQYDDIAENAKDVMVALDTRGTFDYDPCPPRPGTGLTMLADLDVKWESQADREEMLELLDHILQLFSNEDWKALDAFVALMNLGYWSRAWVVQEMALANHDKSLVLIGDKLWAWATLVNAAHTLMVIMYLFNAGKEWPALKEWPRDKILMLRWHSVILDQFISGTMSAQPLTLSELIPRAIFRTTDATLQIDHVYSLLSLASDHDTCGITPNYTKSVSQVYQEVVAYLLRTIGADALTFCEICRTSKLDLPSWVPDFSCHNVWTLKLPRPVSTGLRLYAAGGSREKFTYQIQGTTLQLRGRRVDTICHFAQFERYDEFQPEDAPAWLQVFQEFVDSAVIRHGTDLTDTWRVPIADQIDVSGDLGVRAPPNMEAAYHELMHHDGVATLSRAAIDYSRALAIWGSVHTPFVTESGYLGLGRPCAMKGDVLFICTGADTPLIVREVGQGEVRIVAEAYLRGFMDGEVLKGGFEEVEVEVL